MKLQEKIDMLDNLLAIKRSLFDASGLALKANEIAICKMIQDFEWVILQEAIRRSKDHKVDECDS